MGRIRKVRVFYAWQSDSPKKTNLNAIREALKIAKEKIEEARPDLRILPDEATRGTSGSPNIALKILEKIEAADVFIADVTTITPPGAQRPCPNPNVGYELGYAVSQLGWDRVILLFNQAFGDFPKDLPFDLVQQRASPYKLTIADSNSARGKLAEFLESAIYAVMDNNPKRPAELRGLSRGKLEHDHDVVNIRWLMSTIHLPTLDQHISELPHIITDRALLFWEYFNGVVANSLFNVYDLILKGAVDRLYFAWRTALSHDEQYDITPGARIHVFTNPLDLPLPPERQKVWDEIDTARIEMRRSLDKILERLRGSYIEVNLHKTNAKAWKDHVAYETEFRKAMDGKFRPKKRGKQRR
jgi:hypothetical protein